MRQESDLYNVDEAARKLELSPACVRQMLRAGELEGERREERLEGVLGPWRIPEHAVHALLEGDPAVLREKRRAVCETDSTTAQLPSSETDETTAHLPAGENDATTAQLPPGKAPADMLSEALPAEESTDRPSEASELLSESVREVQEKAEALRKELELLEGRLELVEMTEFALREDLRREKERADRERETADGLRAELEAERAGRRGVGPQEESGRWLSKG